MTGAGFIAGLAIATAGVALIFVPAALIIGGLTLAGICARLG